MRKRGIYFLLWHLKGHLKDNRYHKRVHKWKYLKRTRKRIIAELYYK